MYAPALFSYAAEKVIQELGFVFKRIDFEEPVTIFGGSVKYYRPKGEILYWDLCVANLYITDSDQSIFIQSDTEISELFYRDVRNKTVFLPNLLVVTNNFNRSRAGSCVGYDNILPIKDKRYQRSAGLTLLEKIIVEPLKQIGRSTNILISGNGYNTPLHGIDHIWSNTELAKLSQALTIKSLVFSLAPGQTCNVGMLSSVSECAWIRAVDNSGTTADPEDMRASGGGMTEEQIKAELDKMAKAMLVSKYGQTLLSQHFYLGRELNTERFCITLISNALPWHFLLDISTVSFTLVKADRNMVKEIPFGIVCAYDDFVALLAGDIQVWEFMYLSASQWYVCERYESPIAFFLEYFGEQLNNELYYANYKKVLCTEGLTYAGA
ncbi:hypothetical protein [Bartonella sp. DGB2]|uniref:hypothetical protein n=1 Tax=Bartonella sp. DGB2 TaxID=3388426 RepID=UPI0039900784